MYRKGTIVLVPFPFTDLSGNKVRPAVIISNGKIGRDVVVVFITTQTKNRGKYLVSIAPNNINNLKSKSTVVCAKIATLDATIVLGEIGYISAIVQKKVNIELKKVLGF